MQTSFEMYPTKVASMSSKFGYCMYSCSTLPAFLSNLLLLACATTESHTVKCLYIALYRTLRVWAAACGVWQG